MSVDDTLEKRLSEPFPKQLLGSLSKGGAKLTYCPVAEVITRLNNTLGIGNWSCQTMSCFRDANDLDWIIAHVRLTVTIEGKLASYDGHGGQQVKRTKEGKILDLGDEFKGAESDALKKAATRLGIALDLARKEEALRYEEAQSLAEVNKLADPAVIAAIETDIDILIPKAKDAFREWWKKNSLPAPKALTENLIPSVRKALDHYLEKQAEEGVAQATAAAEDVRARESAESAPTEPTAPEAGMTQGEAVAAVEATFPGATEVDPALQ